jgi:hypothetical protein
MKYESNKHNQWSKASMIYTFEFMNLLFANQK